MEKHANLLDLPQREIALLKEINRILLAPGSLPEVLDAILSTFERLYGKHYICVFLLDEKTQELYLMSGRGVPVQVYVMSDRGVPVPDARRRLGIDGIIGHAAAAAEPLYIANTQADPRYIPILGDAGEQFRSEFAVQLKVRDQVIGVLNAESTEVDGFPPEIRDLLCSLADSLAIAIDTARAHEVEKLRAHRMARLAEVTGRVSAGQNVSEVLVAILHAASELFSQCEAGMWLLEPDTQMLRLCTFDPSHSRIVHTDKRIPIGTGLAGGVAAQGEVVTSEDVSTDPRLAPELRETALHQNWHAYAAASLRAEVKLLGVLHVAAHERRSFTSEETQLLATLAHQAAWPLARVKLIEELEESHASLKEEKDFARNLVAHAHDPIAILEPDGHFSWTNEQCNAFTGYSLEEKRRLRLFDLLLPEDRAAAERQWRQVTQGSAGLCELRLRRKDGEVRHAIFSLSPIRASDDQLSGVLAIGRDITEQKQAERELARLAAYPNLNPNPVLECDAEGRITYANPAASRLLQTLSPARLLPRDFSERVKRCLEQNVELHGQETEANSQTLLWSFHPLPAINRVHIYAADITERKHAEEALRQSEEKYRTILENIEDGYFEVDLAGNLTFFNDSFRRLLGYPEEELLGMNNREYMDAENAKSVYQTFNNVYRTGIPAKESDWEIIQKDGAKRIVEGSVSLIWNATGESIGFRGVVRDITERRQAQLRLAESDRLAALGRLIAGVAHELNNPLQGILGFAELLQRRPALDTTEQRYAEQIQQESERAKKIVVNLLTFARQSRLEKTPVDLNALVQRILELRAYSLRLADVQLESRLRPLPPLHADAHRLQQVFLNLLLNAEQALEQIPDGRQLFVTTELADTPEGQVVRVSVRDTGLGIPRDHLSRIFEPFFTTKQPGEGTGLGLAIAYAIVREHGGTIELSSEPGHGTTAVVTLPVTPAAVQPAAAETNTAHDPGPTAGSNQGRGTVLVVDDEEAIREFLAEGLGAEGFRVDTAPNAHQALARLRAHRYDLVLCDIKMPGKSGIELFQEISREQPDLDSRFIFITGDVMSPETREFLTNCPVRYLLKPFRVSDVRALLPNSP